MVLQRSISPPNGKVKVAITETTCFRKEAGREREPSENVFKATFDFSTLNETLLELQSRCGDRPLYCQVFVPKTGLQS